MAFAQTASRLFGTSALSTQPPPNADVPRVPVALAAAAIDASLYDVPGGYRAVMFDRFSGVKPTATGEGTHFLVPWLQRAILYDVRIKPRVSYSPIGRSHGG
jgi:hypothetical protein